MLIVVARRDGLSRARGNGGKVNRRGDGGWQTERRLIQLQP
jgi:hypothetical protein